MTTSRRTALVTTLVAIVILAIVGTVAVAMYDGIQAGRKSHPAGATLPQVAIFPAAPTDTAGVANTAGTGTGSAANGATTGSAVPGSSAIIQPYPGGGPFAPGLPPFGQAGVAGDGLSAWGVAFKQSSEPAAQPDAALIKSAYQDAQAKAQTLASATGIKLGKLVAISDYGQAQPYYGNPCIQPEITVPPGQPGAAIPSRPVPAPSCQVQHYVVAWVLLRYQIG